MGSPVNLSTLGLYNWDNTIFDLMTIPTGLDKTTLVNNLLAETAELEVLYPNPVVFKSLVGVWSAKELDVWNRLYATTQYEYNPIENYNRYEEGSTDGADTTTHTGTDTTDITRRDGGSDTLSSTGKYEHSVAGFDAPTPTAQDDGLFKQSRDNDTVSSTNTYGKTETDQNRTTYNSTQTKSLEGSHELHAHGNIGVTTTQKLILEQREVDLFNVYDIIIESFKMRFCILVY